MSYPKSEEALTFQTLEFKSDFNGKRKNGFQTSIKKWKNTNLGKVARMVICDTGLPLLEL